MFDVFRSVKPLLKLDKICIDNNIFRLHYKATFVILVTASLLVTSKQYIGDPIDCIVDDIPGNVMDTYCWIHSTHSLNCNDTFDLKNPEAHPGVSAACPGGESAEDGKVEHKYYQWVCFTLFFQAILFYIPRYLWKLWEGGKMKMLVQELNLPIVEENTKLDRIQILIDYFTDTRHNHNSYTFRFFFCELLNFINVVGQIYFMDFFLGGEFTTYGSDVLAMSEQPQQDRNDPMSAVFPKVTKCTFHKFGSSGTVETKDGLCILPLNIINEKIYVFLWIWFTFLAIATGIFTIYRLALLVMPGLRLCILNQRARLVGRMEVENICRRLRLGDWFILYQLGKNIDPMIFREFMEKLHKRMLDMETVPNNNINK